MVSVHRHKKRLVKSEICLAISSLFWEVNSNLQSLLRMGAKRALGIKNKIIAWFESTRCIYVTWINNCFESTNIDLNQLKSTTNYLNLESENLQIDHVVTLSQSLSKIEMLTTSIRRLSSVCHWKHLPVSIKNRPLQSMNWQMGQ